MSPKSINLPTFLTCVGCQCTYRAAQRKDWNKINGLCKISFSDNAHETLEVTTNRTWVKSTASDRNRLFVVVFCVDRRAMEKQNMETQQKNKMRFPFFSILLEWIFLAFATVMSTIFSFSFKPHRNILQFLCMKSLEINRHVPFYRPYLRRGKKTAVRTAYTLIYSILRHFFVAMNSTRVGKGG